MIHLGPDERTYTEDARVWAQTGARGMRARAERYLTEPGARDYPSPIRWGWALAMRASHRAALFFAFVAAGHTLAVSPLLVHLARRRLQDTAVAALTVACVVAARADGDWALALAFAGLLALKPEGALLTVPAILLSAASPHVTGAGLLSHGGAVFALSMVAGGALYAIATAALFGPRLATRLWRALAQKHDTDYGREHQRGMWHRLFVDLALVSPVWVAAGLWYHPAAAAPALALVVAHACTPVRNVRTVLAADLLLRAALYPEVSAWVIFVGYSCDGYVIWRASRAGLYDTPTTELVRALVGPRRSE